MPIRIALCCLLALSWSTPARAEIHVGVGAADAIDGEYATAATVSWLSEQRHPWEVMGGYIWARSGPGGGVPEAAFLALSKRLTRGGWFVSGGVAWVSADNDVLSGHNQFLTGLGYDFGRCTLALRHMSNGGTNGRNRGETLLVLDIGF